MLAVALPIRCYPHALRAGRPYHQIAMVSHQGGSTPHKMRGRSTSESSGSAEGLASCRTPYINPSLGHALMTFAGSRASPLPASGRTSSRPRALTIWSSIADRRWRELGESRLQRSATRPGNYHDRVVIYSEMRVAASPAVSLCPMDAAPTLGLRLRPANRTSTASSWSLKDSFA
jgi:hypothetical protein